MITLKTLQDMFADIREETAWNIDAPMLWGYFFKDKSAEKLDAVIPELVALGFRYVDLYLPDFEEGEDEFYFLHVEKEEMHTPDSLFELNSQLDAFADRHKLDAYDGMDVGPINS